MLQAAGSLVAIAILLAAGAVLARRGLLGDRAVDGLKVLITQLTLPLLLFRAFLQLDLEGRNAVLALVVFSSCALMGAAGAAATRFARLPRPETRLLFQGFEAGMLGYAFFAALHSSDVLPAFAALDIGQVVYVFTVLMVQMSVLEQRRVRESVGAGASPPPADGSAGFTFPWRALTSSVVLWAITAGVTISLLAPDLATAIAGPGGAGAALFDTIGGLTTPLVCLVIGASLADGIPRDPAIVRVVALRTLIGLGLGLLVGLVVVPGLGFDVWHSKAAIMLFVLPAPFVIPVYYRRNPAMVGSVLTLSTATSIVLIAVLAVLGIA